jgi:hypothetical protein
MDGKGPAINGRGKLAERFEVAECFLLTSIVQLLTECIFWTRPVWDLSICAKNLFIAARPNQRSGVPWG